MSSNFGKYLRVTVFGQSHSTAIGTVVEGLPPGIPIDMAYIQQFMARRAPGGSNLSTPRKEADQVQILSGVAGSVTCDAPLAAIIHNTNTRPGDYDNLRYTPRPGHSDYTAGIHSGGMCDLSGGGHFSGRLTAPLCFAGAVCSRYLQGLGVRVVAHTASIAGVQDTPLNPLQLDDNLANELEQKPLAVIDDIAGDKMQQAILTARSQGDSVGGSIECAIYGLPAGLGEPMFETVEGMLAYAMFGIPAIKGIEFGSGFAGTNLTGSQNNDPFAIKDGRVITTTNHCGGVLGGITTGMPVVFRVGVKPTPSIAKPQQTVHLQTSQPCQIAVQGRHDPCIVPRAVPVVQAVAAAVATDLILGGKAHGIK